MRTTFGKTGLVFLLLSTVIYSTALAEEILQIDTTKSSVEWKGTKVTGSHNGTLAIKSGTVTIDNGKPIGGTVVFDMHSINNLDLTDPTYKNKLENHLKSDDFFNVTEFETASFEIQEISPGTEPQKYTIKGLLTVKGISKEIEFESTITTDDSTYIAKSDLTFDRTLWNIKYNSGKFFDIANLGDKLIYDEIGVTFKLVTAKKTDA